jgi:hypothetical protein
MSPRLNFPNGGTTWIPPHWQKPCSARQWNDGVLAVSSVASEPPILVDVSPTLFDDIPISLASDGAGGAFVVTACSIFVPGSLGPFALRAIGPTGSRSQLVQTSDPRAWIGVLGIWSEAVLVPSGSRHCIVLWGKNQSVAGLVAQRYNDSLAARWQNGNPVQASLSFSSSSAVKNSLVAEPDGQSGAIAAWIMPGVSGNNQVQIQRLAANGTPLWGPDGTTFGTVTGQTFGLPQTWAQLVSDGNGGAIVIMPEASGAGTRYVAQAIDANGAVTGAANTIVPVAPNDWVANFRLRRAVPDGSGGLFLVYADLNGALRALRYSTASGVSWDIPIGTPFNRAAFHIQEDDRGGFLLTFVSASPLPKIELMRIDRNGTVTWNINSVSSNNQILVGMPAASAVWTNDVMSRMTHAVPDANGGAILVHQNWLGGGAPKLFTACYDSTGAQISPAQAVSARPTAHELPVVISGGGTSAIVAWADDGAASANGLDVWVQRLGCCVPEPVRELPWPRFGCEIIEFAGAGFREMVLQFPCGNRERQWGVLPLTRLFSNVRGLNYPGSIFNRDVERPDWMRIAFLGLPEDTDIRLYSMKGKLLGTGKAIRGEAKKGPALQTVLTFRPSQEEDQLLLFITRQKVERGKTFLIGVHSDWGNGKPSPLGPQKSRR